LLRAGRIVVAAVAALSGVGLVAGFQSAAERPSGPGLTLPPGSPTPGAGFRMLSAYKVVVGAQIYSCVANPDGTGTWSTPVSRPEALLRSYGGLIPPAAGLARRHRPGRCRRTRRTPTLAHRRSGSVVLRVQPLRGSRR